VSRYQKGKTNLDFTETRDSEWQWRQLGHMQVCTSLQTDNHASTSPLSFFTDRMPFLPPSQSTEGKCYPANPQQIVSLVFGTPYQNLFFVVILFLFLNIDQQNFN